MRKIYAFLALCLIFIGATSAMAADGSTFKDFSIDLTTAEPVIPDNVTQVSYPQENYKATPNSGDLRHGWSWFAAKFAVDGPVKITLGGCQYISDGYEGYVTDDKGTKLGDIKNKTEKCYHDGGNVATFEYKGEATTLIVYCGHYCPLLKVEKIEVLPDNVKEKAIYSTKFQDWTASQAKDNPSIKVNTTDGQEITFSLYGTHVVPDGPTSDDVAKKLTSECITTGYLQAEKKDKIENATSGATITTSAFDNITSLTFVHAATGSNRGWGLKVKGDGDDDWVVLSNAVANPATGQEVTVNVNRTNVQLQFFNIADNQYAFLTSLVINGKVEVEERTFVSFVMDFRKVLESQAPFTLTQDNKDLKGVSLDAGSFHDAQHGFEKVELTVQVDGPVHFTIGSCKYTDKATVSIDGGTPIDIETFSEKCDDEFGQYNYFAEYTYNEEQPATLKFNLGKYCPFFKAETCDYTPTVTVAYYNTDGKLIGEDAVTEGSELKYKYYAGDATIPSGHAFRGWFSSKAATAEKVPEGTIISADTKLYAKTSVVERAMVGTHFNYDLTQKNWYQEDHELIDIENGKYHNEHGWIMSPNGTIQLQVAGKCYVTLKNCQWSSKQTVSVKIAGVKEIATFDLPVSTDGETTTIKYDGSETTLTFTFPVGSAYIHGIEVYNVEDFLAYDENTHYYEIAPNDAAGLLLALNAVKDGDKIFLPNGTYDLGETVLSTISANNVSLIGESMDKTIIRNAPDKSKESINATATLLNTSKNLYIQDLTIQNALDYYAIGGTGRAVCLQDKGENTICKNVKMLSYQDTYYSNNTGKYYWEDSEIHGCVDYLCGDGDIIYNRCNFVNESRSKDKKSGSDILCAPSTSDACKWGYTFLDCSISSLCSDFTFARGWSNVPRAQFIRTKLLDNALASERFCKPGINVVPDRFGEFGTTNAAGEITTPASNKVTFTASNNSKELETVLSADEAAKYTVANIFGEWAPDQIAAQVTDKDKGSVFLVNGKITTVRPTEGQFRIANERGGFGPTIDLAATSQADGKDVTAQYIKNADFSDGLNEWTASKFADPKKQALSNNAIESYAGWGSLDVTEFSVTQKITLPAGSYKLVNNSFFRQAETYNSDATKSLAFLKAGDKQVALKTLGSETAISYANSQTDGAGVTTAGMYANEITFELTGSEEIEIGVVGTFDEMKSWCIVGGFKLYDLNQEAETIDMTKRIANHSFENGFENWNVEGEWQEQTNGQAVQIGTRYVEKWQSEGGLPAGKVSQTIEGLTNGKYIVKASAIATAEGTQVFANDKAVAAPTEAAIVSIEVEVTDGKLTIGFERTAENQANWTAVDNFELFYVPEKLPTAIETVTVATTKDAPKKFFKNNKVVILKNGKTYNVAGQELK